jgi:hypothetical protein
MLIKIPRNHSKTKRFWQLLNGWKWIPLPENGMKRYLFDKPFDLYRIFRAHTTFKLTI